MADYQFPKTEYDNAVNAVDQILKQPVDQIVLSDSLPTTDDVSDSNSVFKGKLSILFVDIRKSTDLTDEIKAKNMVKVYRAFARVVIQAIRHSGGYARQIVGDGIMGVFQDDDEGIKSSQKAVLAARYMLTLIDHCLNPQFVKQLPDVRIGCGIGICTGDILVTKVGMRGKEADDTAENEVGIIWAGSATNYANKFCNVAKAREIFIDSATLAGLSDKTQWIEASRIKNNRVFAGYVSEHYYLKLPDGTSQEPVVSEDDQEPQNVNSDTRAISLLNSITEKASMVAVAESDVRRREEAVKNREAKAAEKEQRLNSRDYKLQSLAEDLAEKDNENKEYEYNASRQLFSTTFCKETLIKELGKDFWMKLIAKMFVFGSAMGKSETEVKSDLDYYLVDIYMMFEMYEEAYDALCIQAEFGSWLHTNTIEEVVKKSEHGAFLKEILETRVEEDFCKALTKIRSMGY
jgi:class 3 adenylate cyclase